MWSVVFVLLVLCANVPPLLGWTALRLGRTCPTGQSCVALTHCREWCEKAETGQIEKNLTVRQELQSSTCQIVGSIPYVCCREVSITEEQNCLLEPGKENDQESQCGQRQTAQDLRCVGCDSTSPGDWPWMARLLYKENIEEDSSVTNCGGILVSSRHVITAGHCVETGNVPDKVALGDSDISTDFDCLDVESGCRVAGRRCFRSGLCAPSHVEVTVRAAVKHPKYKHCENCVPFYDIAVIVLDDFAKFSTYIQPICLPNPPSEHPVQAPLVITGWGNIHGGFFKHVPAKVLQKLVVQEVPLKKCGETWGTNLLPSQICVSSGTSGQAPCQGDSGGPLVRLVDRSKEVWELAGVISFGPGVCGNAYHPVGLTRISGDVLEWVRAVVGRYELGRT
eukprot:GFUD01002813.1.p1 GENE.GFUD01002813.1~~GFUD01002813.1.p1  ORF type:complete len:394 (+),score=79.73 GFUD01002813.1:712-1893(+)